MSESSSEEKSQPGSAKKLRDARRKGQVAKSQDFVTALVVLACTVFLGFASAHAVARVRGLLDAAAGAYGPGAPSFALAWPPLAAQAIETLAAVGLPLVLATVAVVFVGNLAILRGLVFSADPVKPDVDRINPASGFKRVFSLRNVVEFLKSLFKLLVLGAAFVLVYRHSLPLLLAAPQCGAGCIYAAFKVLLHPLAITAVLAFLATGLVDLLIQHWLFARDMRMTHSEQKRERKDTEGSPQIRKERQRQRSQSQASASVRGLEHASLIIGSEQGWVVGVRYARGQTKVPVIVFIAPPERSAQAWHGDAAQGIARVRSPDLASAIARSTVPGDPLPERFFRQVADLLVATRVI